ncbi:MAG: hypothetical protein DRQ99_33975 [Candidatus Parabeggiatoa sp. nov. 3]|nr:MAG: hypothetical protein DRQ99_33975 [Gammaproteobacteria bacterium]
MNYLFKHSVIEAKLTKPQKLDDRVITSGKKIKLRQNNQDRNLPSFGSQNRLWVVRINYAIVV